VHLLNEDTVPYKIHIGTSGQITPTFAKNFVIYLYLFPKLQPRPKKKGNTFRYLGVLQVRARTKNKRPDGQLATNMLIYGMTPCDISLVKFKAKTCAQAKYSK